MWTFKCLLLSWKRSKVVGSTLRDHKEEGYGFFSIWLGAAENLWRALKSYTSCGCIITHSDKSNTSVETQIVAQAVRGEVFLRSMDSIKNVKGSIVFSTLDQTSMLMNRSQCVRILFLYEFQSPNISIYTLSQHSQFLP
jgi:hypothetical protein